MKNHLLIGLGGTGGKILREFRKSLVEQYRTLEPEGVNLGYLYVDSDASGMGPTDKAWRTLGHNVQLPKQSQLEIGAANLAPVIQNLNAYPGVKGWIGDKGFWSGVLTTQRGATVLGGQKRRLGRFLFSQKAEDFVSRVKTLATALRDKGDAEVTFHVCCGLAGGTGSGSVIDAITQIRSEFDNSRTYPIFVYALLPDRTPANGWDTGNYHANGYAALMELNALHVGAFQPHDVTGKGGGQRRAVTDPFNLCYVFSNENENNAFINVNTEAPGVISSFLSAAILTAHKEGLDGFRRVVTAENLTNKITPEPQPDGNGAARSRMFGVFGIKQLAYPEEEIREYLAYAFARQATLQLSSNNWRDLVGYVAEPRPVDFTEFVRKPEIQTRWKFSIEHLTLSLGILDGEIADPRWRPVAAFWGTLASQWLGAVTRNETTRTKWMPELKDKFDEMYSVGYRAQGVREFFRGKLKAKREHADEIIRTIERELMDGWLAGERSLGEITKLLGALRGAVQDMTEKAERLEADDRARVTACDQRVAMNDAEWGKCGPGSRVLNRDKNVLNAQSTVLQEKYTTLTRVAGWEFAKALLMELGARLDDLTNEVAAARKTVDDAASICQQQASSRCSQTAPYDLNRLVVTFFNTQAVRDLVTTLERDENQQAAQTRAVRVAIKDKIGAGENPTFSKFNGRIRADTLVELLEVTCDHSADLAHNEAVSGGQFRERLLGVNVVDKLYDQFAGRPDELTEFIHQLVGRAGRYGTFSGSEQAHQGKGLSVGAPPSEFAVLLPESADRTEFRERLATAFRGASGDVPISVFPSSRRNEITLISVAAGFPLRFLEDVRYLGERYARRLSDDERAKIEVHLEGDGTQYPTLYLPDAGDRHKRMIESLLIAEALDLVQRRARGGNGKTRLVRVIYDEDGDEKEVVDLGGNVFEAAEQATDEAAFSLSQSIDAHMRRREMRAEDARSALRKTLSEKVKQMKDALEDSESDYRDQLTAALQGAKARLQMEMPA